MKTLRLILAACAALALAPTVHAQQTPTPAPASPDYVAQLRTGPTALLNSPTIIAARTAAQVPMLTGQLFNTLGSMSKALWADPTKAQAIVDSLGEKAAPLFIAYGEFAGPLAVIDPITYAKLPAVPAGYSWTILPPQADGTWAVGQRSVLINYAAPTPAN